MLWHGYILMDKIPSFVNTDRDTLNTLFTTKSNRAEYITSSRYSLDGTECIVELTTDHIPTRSDVPFGFRSLHTFDGHEEGDWNRMRKDVINYINTNRNKWENQDGI